MEQSQRILTNIAEQLQKQKISSKARKLRKKKAKSYQNFCQKHHSTIQKKTTIIHNTFVFSIGPDGKLQKTFHQKVRDRKSKESIVKGHKMRKEAQDINSEIQRKLQEEKITHELSQTKMEIPIPLPHPTFNNVFPYMPYMPNMGIFYNN